MTKEMLPPKIEIVWLDHITSHDWTPLWKAKGFQLSEVHTIGYIIDENDDRIITASTFSPSRTDSIQQEESVVSEVTVIAKRLILSIKNLEVEEGA